MVAGRVSRRLSASARLAAALCGVLSVVVAAALALGSPSARGRVATSPPGGHAYVVEPSANAVAVVDTASGRVITKIAVGQVPRQAAVSSDGRRVYIANAGSRTVSVIDAVSDTVIATIPVPEGALRLTLAPDGHQLYVAGSGSRSVFIHLPRAPAVSVIDTAQDEVVRTFDGDTNGAPAAIAISHDERFIYLLCLTQKINHPNLITLDVATGQQRSRELVRTVPSSTSLISHGDRLYVIESQLDRVIGLDDATGMRQSSIEVKRPISMAVDPTGNRLYVLGDDDEVSVLRSSDHRVMERFSADPGAASVAVTPDGRELLINHPAKRTLTIDDARSGRWLHSVPVGGDGSSVAISPDFAPEATAAPADQAVEFGRPVILTAEARGHPSPHVRWQRSTDGGLTWSPIEHADEQAWSFTPGVADSGDQYRAVFSNQLGQIATRPASITVVKATPVIEWPNPPPLSVGDPLPAADLDARAETPTPLTYQPAPIGVIPVAPNQHEIPGTDSYEPAAGTVLPAGDQHLTVTFTPTDSQDYNPATVTVPIEVRRASPPPSRCTTRTGLTYFVPRRLHARILAAHVIDSRGRSVRTAQRRGRLITAALTGLPAGRYRLRVAILSAGRQRTITTTPTRCSATH
jgi:YVTN family beta-propeller protein